MATLRHVHWPRHVKGTGLRRVNRMGLRHVNGMVQPGLQLRGGVDRAPWLDPPPKRAQLTGPPKSYRD